MSTPDGRRVLVLCRSAPYGGPRARDALDLAMAFGAFEQQVALLLLGDGVLLLAGEQRPVAEFSRSLSALSGTLPDYGIDAVHVEAKALEARGLRAADLAVPVRALDETGIAALLASHDFVLTV